MLGHEAFRGKRSREEQSGLICCCRLSDHRTKAPLVHPILLAATCPWPLRRRHGVGLKADGELEAVIQVDDRLGAAWVRLSGEASLRSECHCQIRKP